MSCCTCLHFGECNDSPYCGGGGYRNAFAHCDRCGRRIDLREYGYEDDGERITCAACLDQLDIEEV